MDEAVKQKNLIILGPGGEWGTRRRRQQHSEREFHKERKSTSRGEVEEEEEEEEEGEEKEVELGAHLILAALSSLLALESPPLCPKENSEFIETYFPNSLDPQIEKGQWQ